MCNYEDRCKQLCSAVLMVCHTFGFPGIIPQSAIKVEIYWREKNDESDWVIKPDHTLSFSDAGPRYKCRNYQT
jgi:hypothetical protein